jgi:HKD family nuclease
MITRAATAIVLLGLLWAPTPAAAAERLCDPAFEDCRTPLLNLIKAETVAIDVAFWFMEDNRYSDALIAKFQAGVPVRVIADLRANSSYPLNAAILEKLKAAGVPIRRAGSRWLHWKMMLFAGQNVVEFSGANYSPNAFKPDTAYANYIDEVVYFSDDIEVVESFKTRYDDIWLDGAYVNYANVTTPVRRYPVYARDPELNFVPLQNYATRIVQRYAAETQQIDITMYRITDRRHTDALIAARQRGVRVRLLSEPEEYRDPNRLWVSWNIDRLHMGGVEIMMRAHQGLNHQKSVLLYSQGMSVIGSSNMTSGSAGSSDEHNYFTSKPWMFTWLVGQFERKWNGSAGVAEYTAFQPLPPTAPTLIAPALSAIRQSTTMSLVWDGGPYAHKYDVYFGTSPNPPLLAGTLDLGRAETPSDKKTYALPPLSPGTTYYWRIVGRTMAEVTKSSPVWSFTTATATDPNGGGLGPGDINLYGSHASIPAGSAWVVVSDATAAGGARIVHPNQNGAKLPGALAAPTNYFELTFDAEQGRPYRLWIRGRAESNNWANDSVFVQLSGSVNDAGTPVYRIGTTSATTMTLEDCSGCGLSGWGWQDNGYGTGVLGPPIYFATTGPQTIRVQTREDGLSIDQILLSPERYLTVPPGSLKSDTTRLPERTGGGETTPPGTGALGPGDVNMHASQALIPAGSAWVAVSDGTAAGGARIVHPNQNGAKLASPLAAPTNYFELTFNAEEGRPYRLWIRGRAESNGWANDSVFVQFSGSVTEAGSPVNRIGTPTGDSVNLEDCSGCGLTGWGWQDNGWGTGVMGPLIYFETTGLQTIRVQTREDGLSIDQILLSPEKYLSAAPGSLKSDTTILPERRQ